MTFLKIMLIAFILYCSAIFFLRWLGKYLLKKIDSIDNKDKKNKKVRVKYPFTLDEYIGHADVVHDLKILISNYREYSKPPGHILFYGNGGLGKTTLAEIIADEMEARFVSIVGESIRNPQQVERILLQIEPGDVLFIDEAHEIRSFESFYHAMQDQKVYLRSGEIHYLPEFTLIAATTRPEKLDKPFRQRFQNHFRLKPYQPEEIEKIIYACVKDEYITGIDEIAAAMIANASHGIIRIAVNTLLDGAKNIALYSKEDYITKAHVNELFKIKKIDQNGISDIQIELLYFLYQAERPVGLNNLAEVMEISKDQLAEIEVGLIKRGLISRTSRGRQITQTGREYYEKSTYKK